jgi:nuclear pore complex protein Nup205
MFLVHYFPAVAAFIALFGAPEGVSSLEEARSLNEKVIGNKDQNPWTLHYVHAAVSVWWLAEYSGWYMDNPPASPLAGVNLDEGQSPKHSILEDPNYANATPEADRYC